MAPFLTVDIETNSLDPHTGIILGVGIDGHYEPDIEWAVHLLRGKAITAHNGSFDLKFLWAAGSNVTLEFDTMVAAYVLPNRPESLSLGSCAEYYLGESADWKQTLKKTRAEDLDFETLKSYCLKDVEITRRLRIKLEEELHKHGLHEFYTQLIKARVALTRAEYKGMNVN